VLVHVGFALAQVDKDEARATLKLLGDAIAAELEPSNNLQLSGESS
jgi:hydrogenase maturation factor